MRTAMCQGIAVRLAAAKDVPGLVKAGWTPFHDCSADEQSTIVERLGSGGSTELIAALAPPKPAPKPKK